MLPPMLDPATWQAASHDPRVLVVGGPGVKLTVRDDCLSVTRGPARSQTTEKIPRIPRAISRVIILANFGMITVEAARWMRDAGIGWTQLDDTGEILGQSVRGGQDARLIRAQSRAVDSPEGLEITRYLLDVKLRGQAAILREYFAAPDAERFITNRADTLSYQETSVKCGVQEGLAASTYWQAWERNVPVPFDARDESRVPGHWLGFVQRHSLAYEIIKNRGATDPVNACLNFLYKVAETECVHACHAAGLSPVLGISHTDKPNRDSMALDLLETIRPACDRIILDLFRSGERFDRRWLRESKDGTLRLCAPLTHRLASHAAGIAAELAPHVHHVAGILASASGGIVTTSKRGKYKDRSPKTTEHRGYPAARLRPGTGVNDLVPDAVWAQIEPLIPPRGKMGRPPAMTDREAVAALAARYLIRCPWSQVRGNRMTVDAKLRAWEVAGTWPKIREILASSGHLAALAA